MPTEVRHLLFRPTEIVQAITTHFRRSGQPLNAGHLAACAVTGDGIKQSIVVRLRIHADGDSSAREEVNVDDATLMAALIMHCRDKGIPLSAKASKFLQVLGDQVCLVAKLN